MAVTAFGGRILAQQTLPAGVTRTIESLAASTTKDVSPS